MLVFEGWELPEETKKFMLKAIYILIGVLFIQVCIYKLYL